MPKPNTPIYDNENEIELDNDTPLGALTEDDMREVLDGLPGYRDYQRERNNIE